MIFEKIYQFVQDGENLYFSRETYFEEQRTEGIKIYKTDLNGNEEQLILNLPGFYGRFMINNGSLYTFKYVEKQIVLYQFFLDSGEGKEISTFNYSEYNSSTQDKDFFYFYNSNSSQKQVVFDVKTGKTIRFEGPPKGLATVFNNKLYYVNGEKWNELYVASDQGKSVKVITSTVGDIIGFSGNYVYCYNKKTDKVTELKLPM